MVRRGIAHIGAALFLTACGGPEEQTPAQEAAQIIDTALNSDHEWLRAETVRLIGLVETDAYRSQLEAKLADDSPMVQTAAIESLLRHNVRTVEAHALGKLVSGEVNQRRRLLDLIVETGRTDFRTEVLLRGLRDTEPDTQIAALRHAVATETHFGVDELQRLLNGDSPRVASEAFLTLTHFERLTALDLVLGLLRSSAAGERERGLQLARHLNSPNLWPMMRAMATQTEDVEMRQMALLVLGHLGDPIAEEHLRDLVLSGRDELAADALRALSNIRTEEAQDQALVHRRDAREAVREAALEALMRQNRPADDFEVFLHDQNPDLAQRALLHMQRRDPERAAGLLIQSLADSAEPAVVLYALYRASLSQDIRPLITAAASRLRGLLAHGDDATAGLAARLLLVSVPPSELVESISRLRSDQALYALLEASYTQQAGFAPIYTDALDHDLHAVRVAAALGVVTMGDAYVAPSEPE